MLSRHKHRARDVPHAVGPKDRCGAAPAAVGVERVSAEVLGAVREDLGADPVRRSPWIEHDAEDLLAPGAWPLACADLLRSADLLPRAHGKDE